MKYIIRRVIDSKMTDVSDRPDKYLISQHSSYLPSKWAKGFFHQMGITLSCYAGKPRT